jgi:hypothetical protein
MLTPSSTNSFEDLVKIKTSLWGLRFLLGNQREDLLQDVIDEILPPHAADLSYTFSDLSPIVV